MTELIITSMEMTGKDPATILREWGDAINIIVNDLIEKRDAIIEIDKKENPSKLDIMTKYTLMLDILLHTNELRQQSLKEISDELQKAYQEIEDMDK
ncbi:MAG: hypothetical protein J6R32_06440 [Bacteroidales bacterium]|nr:hypothetical protein [Bacteroidales bacterium]